MLIKITSDVYLDPAEVGSCCLAAEGGVFHVQIDYKSGKSRKYWKFHTKTKAESSLGIVIKKINNNLGNKL